MPPLRGVFCISCFHSRVVSPSPERTRRLSPSIQISGNQDSPFLFIFASKPFLLACHFKGRCVKGSSQSLPTNLCVTLGTITLFGFPFYLSVGLTFFHLCPTHSPVSLSLCTFFVVIPTRVPPNSTWSFHSNKLSESMRYVMGPVKGERTTETNQGLWSLHELLVQVI